MLGFGLDHLGVGRYRLLILMGIPITIVGWVALRARLPEASRQDRSANRRLCQGCLAWLAAPPLTGPSHPQCRRCRSISVRRWRCVRPGSISCRHGTPVRTMRSRQGQAWRPVLMRSPKLGSGAGPVGHGRSHQRGGSPPRSPKPMSRPPRKPTTHSARRTVVPSTGIPCPSQRTDAPAQGLRLPARPARRNRAYNLAGGQVPHQPERRSRFFSTLRRHSGAQPGCYRHDRPNGRPRCAPAPRRLQRREHPAHHGHEYVGPLCTRRVALPGTRRRSCGVLRR
jgi:hypothetical protein